MNLRKPQFSWFVVSTHFEREVLARERIKALRLCAGLPEHCTTTGRIKPLFPRYLLVQSDLCADAWRLIYRQPGVVTILGTRHERPTCLPAGALEILWAQCSADGVIRPPKPAERVRLAAIAPGAVVEIVGDSPFAGLRGIVRFSSRERVAILLQVLGGGERQVSVPRRDVVLA